MRHVPVEGRHGIYTSTHVDGSKTFECRFKDSNGKHKFRACGSQLEDALDFQATIRIAHRKGEHVVSNGTAKFSDLADAWLEYKFRKGHSLSQLTENNYRSVLRVHLTPRFGRQRARDITADHITFWLTELDLGSARKQLVYVVLNEIFKYAANPRRGYLGRNPCDSLEAGEKPRATQKPHRVITADETAALLAAASDTFKPVLQTALLTGMRASEILGVRWQDIDFTNRNIRCEGQLDTKGNHVATKGKEPRDIPMLPSLETILKGLPSRFQQGYVFNINYGQLNRGWLKTRSAAGISDQPREMVFHDCRHTFASALLLDGKDVIWVSQILGHKDAKTTLETYAHVVNRQDRLEDASSRLSVALGGWVQ